MTIRDKSPVNKYNVSAQYLIDCDYIDNECSSGNPSSSLEFLHKKKYYHGAYSNYIGKAKTCDKPRGIDIKRIGNFKVKSHSNLEI